MSDSASVASSTAGPVTMTTADKIKELQRKLEELGEQEAQLRESRDQVDTLTDLAAQLVAQFGASKTGKPKGKMASPEKYEGGREGLKPFLTNIDLYCRFNNVLNDHDKILAAGMHMKGRAASWIQPYTEDYLSNPDEYGTRADTQTLFRDWKSF